MQLEEVDGSLSPFLALEVAPCPAAPCTYVVSAGTFQPAPLSADSRFLLAALPLCCSHVLFFCFLSGQHDAHLGAFDESRGEGGALMQQDRAALVPPPTSDSGMGRSVGLKTVLHTR